MDQVLLDRAIELMICTDRMHKCRIDETAGRFGMGRTAHKMLMYLSRTSKCPSQKELADKFSITPAAVTGVLKRLETEGYILRTIGKDTRYNEISITEKGRKMVESTRTSFRLVDSSLFEDFSDEELEGYIRALEKIQRNLKKGNE